MTTGSKKVRVSRPKKHVKHKIPKSGETTEIDSTSEDVSWESIPPPPPVPPPPPPRKLSRAPDGSQPLPRDNYAPPPPRRPPPRRRYRDDFRPRPRLRPRRHMAAPMPPPYYPEDDYYDYPPRRPPPRPRRRPEYDYEGDYYDNRPPPRKQPPREAPKSTSSGGGGGRGLAVIVAIIIILLLLYMFRGPISDFINDPPPLKYHEYPEWMEFTVRKDMTIELESNGGSDSISYQIKSACPKDRSISGFKLQDVKEVDLDPNPDNGIPDKDDPTLWTMLWEDDYFSGSKKTISVEYTIRTQFYEWELEEGDAGTIDDLPNGLKQQYNHDEWRYDLDHDNHLDTIDEDRNNNNRLDPGEDRDNDRHLDVDEDIDNDGEWDYFIEPSNPKIQSLAKRWGGGESNVFTIVESFYNKLAKENLNYQTSSQGLPKDCDTMRNELVGDCDDYSILFISLCRAMDIPAWLELGILYDKNQDSWGGHAWAKVAIPLKDGGYAAPTIDIVNKQFLYHDTYRFIEWRDTGGEGLYPGETEVRNNLDYYYHTFSYEVISGSPTIHSPNTNNFYTVAMDESDDKVKIAADDDSGPLGLCMIPGFDAIYLVFGILIIAVFIVIIPTRYRN